jgi:probable rRNA maturation factor
MPKSSVSRAPGAVSRRKRNSGPMARFALPLTEVLVVADCWQTEPDAEAIIQRAIATAAEMVDARLDEARLDEAGLDEAGLGEAGLGEAELAVMLTDDAGIRTLNSNWRGIDKPTNVLSFPALPPSGPSGPDDAPRMLGDIAIAYQTTRGEADEEQKPFDHHLSHLAVHGFLHLIGYDHEQDDDAEAMEALESEILAQLGIPDPYADRDPDADRERMD